MKNATDFDIKNGVLCKYVGLGDNLVIPSGVTKIALWMFYGCESLKSIVIPDSVTEINAGAFSYCSPVIHAHSGNYVEKYAKENDFEFIAK